MFEKETFLDTHSGDSQLQTQGAKLAWQFDPIQKS